MPCAALGYFIPMWRVSRCGCIALAYCPFVSLLSTTMRLSRPFDGTEGAICTISQKGSFVNI
ncbi:MAG TPA: hypothetical protein GXX52_04710 [Synergistaceae bacterium]|nr:hypothetical protein [Synergistaceae bacterium]